MNHKELSVSDPEIFDLIKEEDARQKDGLEMIASENYVSSAVLEAVGSILTNKYAEGYPSHRYYGGCFVVDKIENVAIERAKRLFNCNYANVQPHSGSQANSAAYAALINPGDTVLGMSLDAGGHLTHGAKVNFSGRVYNSVQYGVDENGILDYERIGEMLYEYNPALLMVGASAYPREIDFKRIRGIVDAYKRDTGKNVYFVVDMAHIAGLVAGGVHVSPIGYADVVTTTCHKTLRGPRGGMILTNDAELAKKIDKAIFPGNQGGPLEHVIAGKAVCFGEALEPSFKVYQQNVVDNCKELAKNLLELGFNLVTGGTDNHLILIDLRSMGITGKEMEARLGEVGITVNKNAIPNDPEKPTVTSGVRVGTAAITTRGLCREDMKTIAGIFRDVAKNQNLEHCKELVKALCDKYKL